MDDWSAHVGTALITRMPGIKLNWVSTDLCPLFAMQTRIQSREFYDTLVNHYVELGDFNLPQLLS
jgi:hypothetical protein